ncbi:MAG: hypothetical protein JRH20_09455 [Deltaproteobacteria bacterium]|nr:hypothetical protein [Deltaproteobacteria bacterium]
MLVGVERACQLSVLALVLTLGCGGDDSPVGSDGSVVHDSFNVQVIVKVILEGVEEDVALGELSTMEIDGESYVTLSDVVTAAFPAESLAQLQADFEGADGFKPGSKDFCKDTIPVDGALLTEGYLHPQSRNMRWNDSLSYPGCMSPTDLAIITLGRKV